MLYTAGCSTSLTREVQARPTAFSSEKLYFHIDYSSELFSCVKICTSKMRLATLESSSARNTSVQKRQFGKFRCTNSKKIKCICEKVQNCDSRLWKVQVHETRQFRNASSGSSGALTRKVRAGPTPRSSSAFTRKFRIATPGHDFGKFRCAARDSSRTRLRKVQRRMDTKLKYDARRKYTRKNSTHI